MDALKVGHLLRVVEDVGGESRKVALARLHLCADGVQAHARASAHLLQRNGKGPLEVLHLLKVGDRGGLAATERGMCRMPRAPGYSVAAQTEKRQPRARTPHACRAYLIHRCLSPCWLAPLPPPQPLTHSLTPSQPPSPVSSAQPHLQPSVHTVVLLVHDDVRQAAVANLGACLRGPHVQVARDVDVRAQACH